MCLPFDLKDITKGTLSLIKKNKTCKICTLGTDLNLLFLGLKVLRLDILAAEWYPFARTLENISNVSSK